jgi:CMP-N-acetylneuraminic acid synthetase
MHESIETILKDHGIYFLVVYRTNSSRVKQKVVRPFTGNGQSLLDIKLDQLYQTGVPNRKVILAGDHLPLKAMVANLSDDKEDRYIFVERKLEYMVDNSIPFSEVLNDIYGKLPVECKHLLITYPTSPLFNKVDYTRAIWEYYLNVIVKKTHDSIMAGEEKRGFFWYENKTVNYQANENHKYTQNIAPVFECNNALWGGNVEVLKKRKYLIGDKPYNFLTSKLSSIDIDTMEEFKMAQQLYSNRGTIEE